MAPDLTGLDSRAGLHRRSPLGLNRKATHAARTGSEPWTGATGGGCGRAGRACTRGRRHADLQQGRRADPVHELRHLSSRRRDRADAAHELRRGPAVGPRHQAGRDLPDDAAVGRRPRGGPLRQRPAPRAEGPRHHRRLGRRRRARRQPARFAGVAGLRRRLADRHAGRGADLGAVRRLADRPLGLQRRLAADQFRRRQVRARGGGPARRAVDHPPRQRLRAGTWWPRPGRQLLARHRRQGVSGRRGQADSRRHHPDPQHALQPEGPARARPGHARRAEVRDRADPAGGDHRRQQQQRHRHPAGRSQLRAGRGSPSSSPRTATCSPSRRA